MAANDKFTVRDFFKRFPDDHAWLDHIMNVRYGIRHICQACKEATFHRLAKGSAFSCARAVTTFIRHHVYPCAGTIFQDSRTSLQLWFYAIFLFVTTRRGVSGKELQRQLGVTYKTAWRMGQQIRRLMDKADGLAMLQAHVELDEAILAVIGLRSAGPAQPARLSSWAWKKAA